MHSWYIYYLPLAIVSVVSVVNYFFLKSNNEFNPRDCISEVGVLDTDASSSEDGLLSINTWWNDFIIEKTVIVRSYCKKIPKGSRVLIVAYDSDSKIFLIEPYV